MNLKRRQRKKCCQNNTLECSTGGGGGGTENGGMPKGVEKKGVDEHVSDDKLHSCRPSFLRLPVDHA